MSLTLSLVRNELEKTWRSRWIVFLVVFGLLLLLAGGLYGFYVFKTHRWSPPAVTPWQTQVRNSLATERQSLANLEQLQKQQSQRGGGGGFVGANSAEIATLITTTKRSISDDQYLLDHDIAPVQATAVGNAALFALGAIIMFLLLRIFGWLASEQIAGERSDRTIAILLSRPASRDQVLLAKSIASFLISLVTVLLVLLIVFAIFAFVYGSVGPLTGNVGISRDGSQNLTAANLAVMPIPVFLFMCIGASMLAVACVQGLAFLVSVLTTRWAAIGIVLAVLFGAPLVSGIIGLIVVLISGNTSSSDFLNYLFFNVLSPVASIAQPFGTGPSGSTFGMNEFTRQVQTLAVWTVAFYAAAWALFHRRQEAG